MQQLLIENLGRPKHILYRAVWELSSSDIHPFQRRPQRLSLPLLASFNLFCLSDRTG
jgi:hypothetical protein